jgi:hypothetical protein
MAQELGAFFTASSTPLMNTEFMAEPGILRQLPEVDD